MSEKRTTARMFHDAGGLDDWRVLFGGAHAYYHTGSFALGAALVTAIAEVAESAGHYPDIDLRPEGVTIRTSSREDGGMSALDIDLARRISEAARNLGLEPDPSQVQTMQVAVAQDADADVRPFWAAVLGYRDLGAEDAIDPHRRNPNFWFHPLDPPKAGRGRYHVDLSVPADQAEARVNAALAAGGRIADDSHVPEWWTLASPDNHGVDIAAWADFEDYD